MYVGCQLSLSLFTFLHCYQQNKLKDKDIVYDYFLDKPHVLSRVNRHVLAQSPVMDLSYPSKQTIFGNLFFDGQASQFRLLVLSCWRILL